MRFKAFYLSLTHRYHFHLRMRKSIAITLLSLAFVCSLLAACGSSSTAAVKASSTPVSPTLVLATPTPSPAPISTPTPIPKPTPVPQSIPVATPVPAQAPPSAPVPAQAAPAILDLRPASMSIVGHRDCQKGGAYTCFARVVSGTGNQSNLNWFASTNVPGGVSFSPASGVLTPGQSVLITITVPLSACTPGLFIFRGPINTHTITWAC